MGLKAPVQTTGPKPRPDGWGRSLDPCAELPGCLIEVHHTWEHQRLASIEIISWPRELLAFELQPNHLNPLCLNEGFIFKASLSLMCAGRPRSHVLCVPYVCVRVGEWKSGGGCIGKEQITFVAEQFAWWVTCSWRVVFSQFGLLRVFLPSCFPQILFYVSS